MPTVDGDVLAGRRWRHSPAGAAADVAAADRLATRDESRLFLVAPGIIELIDEPTLPPAPAAYGLTARRPRGLPRTAGRHPR